MSEKSLICYLIMCDGCGDTFRPGKPSRYGIGLELRRKARRHGWQVRPLPYGVFVDLCPSCADRQAEADEEERDA